MEIVDLHDIKMYTGYMYCIVSFFLIFCWFNASTYLAIIIFALSRRSALRAARKRPLLIRSHIYAYFASIIFCLSTLGSFFCWFQSIDINMVRCKCGMIVEHVRQIALRRNSYCVWLLILFAIPRACSLRLRFTRWKRFAYVCSETFLSSGKLYLNDFVIPLESLFCFENL